MEMLVVADEALGKAVLELAWLDRHPLAVNDDLPALGFLVYPFGQSRS
jgi:hypothetical protein